MRRGGQGRAGQGRAGQGRAGQGRAGQGRAGQGRAGQGRAGWYGGGDADTARYNAVRGAALVVWVGLGTTQLGGSGKSREGSGAAGWWRMCLLEKGWPRFDPIPSYFARTGRQQHGR